jgi:NTP pyrophosphatase (non-canonical NTP hydrolase)
VYEVTAKNRASCRLDNYARDCGRIWKKDAERPVFDLYYHVALHTSKIGESLRREQYDDALHELAETTIWLLSLVNKLNTVSEGPDRIFRLRTPVSQIIWNKFPNCCPVCFSRLMSEPGKSRANGWLGKMHKCDCLLRLSEVEVRNQIPGPSPEVKKEIKKKLRAYADEYRPQSERRLGLKAFEQRFEQIFDASIFVMSIETIGFHLFEEIGEIADALMSVYTYREDELKPALRAEKIHELENEIADAFSWIFSISIKLRSIYTLPDRTFKRLTGGGARILSLSFEDHMWLYQIIWDDYGDPRLKQLRCRDCGKSVCDCDIRLAYNHHREVGILLRERATRLTH